MVTGVVLADEPDVVTGRIVTSQSPPTGTTASHPMAHSVPIMHVTNTLSNVPMSQSVPPTVHNHPNSEKPTVASGQTPDRQSVIHNHYIIAPSRLGRDPHRIDCPSCQQSVMTKVRHRVDAVTWITFLVVLLLFWPLCWLPFVIPSCQSSDHECPNCGALISTTRGCE
jgi:lipopolysaccharide-induced tumor necrosis factor-alpha factor